MSPERREEGGVSRSLNIATVGVHPSPGLGNATRNGSIIEDDSSMGHVYYYTYSTMINSIPNIATALHMLIIQRADTS